MTEFRSPGGDQQSAELIDWVLSPATRLLWRSPDSIQLQLGRAAVIVDGLPTALVRRLARPVRTPLRHVVEGRGEPADGQTSALEDRSARHALVALAEAGYLWQPPDDADDPRYVPPHPRLAGELTAMSTRSGHDAAELLNARRHATVEVWGSARVGPQIAAVLGAAGVGRVHCSAPGDARLRHAAPGGVLASDEGMPLSLAARQAVLRAAPDTDTDALPPGERADLTILAVDEPVPDDRRRALHAGDAAHLVVTVAVDHGVVGPLVLPGLTSCLQCADLHRRDRDPAWPALAVQLTVPQRYGPATGVALATTIAALAATQALAFLDGTETAALDATLEISEPDWRIRRRSWFPHPDCDCVEPLD